MAATKRSTPAGQKLKANQRPAVKDLDIEEIEHSVSKALGVAMALSELGGDEHNARAAEAIADQLHVAKLLLAGGTHG